MASRRTFKAVNWAPLMEHITEAEKGAFIMFKTKTENYLKRVQQLPEQPPAIDWAYYKKKVPVQGLVDKFQKEYEAMKVPYPEDKYSSIIDQQMKESEGYIKQFIDDSNKRIEEYLQEIDKLQGLLKYGQMTMEDFAEAHPDLVIDPVNRPTFFPHTEEVACTKEELEELKKQF